VYRRRFRPHVPRLPPTRPSACLSQAQLVNSIFPIFLLAIDLALAQTPTVSAFGYPSAIPHPKATIMFDFTASSPYELSAMAGTVVNVLEEDDGSGWVKVGDANGGKGLVPATYVQLEAVGQSSGTGTIRGTRPPGGSGQYGKSGLASLIRGILRIFWNSKRPV
jgi:hypothetical protein